MPKPPVAVTGHIWRKGVLLWLPLFAAGLGLLWASGAFRAEFGEYPDEPSHYVTGLMVRDYIASLAPSPPIDYAENYYLHYPRVGLGHYPPLLYVVEAVWMLVFPVSKPSLLVLNVLLTSLAAAFLCLVVRKEFGTCTGIGAGLLLTALPVLQRLNGMVMAEPLTFLLTFAAVICYARYLETGRWSRAACFGLLASLALLTKQVTLFLGLVPPLALLLTRQFRLLRRLSFWLPALIVIGLAAPWYVFVSFNFRIRMAAQAGYPFAPPSLAAQAIQFITLGGWALALPFAAGLWSRVVRPLVHGLPVQGGWAAYAASIVAFLVWQRVAPAAAEDRHLLCIAPCVLLFVVAGVAWLAGSVSKLGMRTSWAAAAVSLLVGLAFGVWTFKLPPRPYRGFGEAASRLTADPQFRDVVLLVCSDVSGEGDFIAEVAAREKRPGHIVLRGSKMLARMTSIGTHYQPLYGTPGELLEYLESVPVGVLVVETAAKRPRFFHEDLSLEMLRRHPDRWQWIGSYPKLRASSSPGVQVRAYRLVGQNGASRIRIDLGRRLGRFIENRPSGRLHQIGGAPPAPTGP